MASNSLLCCLLIALLVALPLTVTANILKPFLSPTPENVCKDVECGRGSCKESSNSTYECQCDPGWMQTRSPKDDYLKFLPCVIPNCTLDTSCTKGVSPVQEKSHAANESILSPCYWADCGGGTCNTTSLFSYICTCDEGYYNLLNISTFPCFKDCELGLDCSNLGLSTSNKSTSAPAPPPTLPENASSVLQGSHRWLIVLMIFLGIVLRK